MHRTYVKYIPNGIINNKFQFCIDTIHLCTWVLSNACAIQFIEYFEFEIFYLVSRRVLVPVILLDF